MRSLLPFLAIIAATYATEQCQTTYKACMASGTNTAIKCSCDLTVCEGEDNERTRAYCATAANPPPPPPDMCQSAYKSCIAAGSTDIKCSCDLGVCLGEDNERSRAYCAAHVQPPAAKPVAGQMSYGGMSYGGTMPPTKAGATYACNPAHQYPAGQVCKVVNGHLMLVNATAPAETGTPPQTFACNPAHQYPPGQVCKVVNGHLALVTITGTAPMSPSTGMPKPVVNVPGNSTVNGVPAATATGTSVAKPPPTSVPFGGGASAISVASGLAAMCAGAVVLLI